MAAQIEHFPPEIEALPDFEGAFDAYRLIAQGCDVLFATYPAGTVIEPHTHSTNNVGVITKGQLTLTIDDHVTIFGIGEWYHVPAGVEHAATFADDSAEIEFWFVPPPS